MNDPEPKLIESMFSNQLTKHRLDIRQDIIFIDFKNIITTHQLSREQISIFSEKVFGLRPRSTPFDVYEKPLITGSVIVRGLAINHLVGLANDSEISEEFIHIARSSGARIMIIEALNLILEQPVINSDLNGALSNTVQEETTFDNL
jgi:hypothetical protein